MLYKVTPMLVPAAPKKDKASEGGPQQRKKRKSVVFDADGNEVLISLMCLKCRTLKPLAQFGLRKMGDGAIRNQPWCRGCRSGASARKKAEDREAAKTQAETAPAALSVAPAPVVESARSVPAGDVVQE